MEAASFDRRILIQKGVKNAREIEVSVLGNDDPVASVSGEVLPSREFYSYESKYIDGTSGLLIPAAAAGGTSLNRIREYAVRAYKAIDCAGMARVDFFVEKDTNRIYLNELNSHPRLYQDQHVSQALGGQRTALQQTGGPFDRTGNGTQGRARPHVAYLSESGHE